MSQADGLASGGRRGAGRGLATAGGPAALELARHRVGHLPAGGAGSPEAAAQAARRAAGDRGGHRGVARAGPGGARRRRGRAHRPRAGLAVAARVVARPVGQPVRVVARAGAAGVRRELRCDPHDGAQARRWRRPRPRPVGAGRGQRGVGPAARTAGGRRLLGDGRQRGCRRDQREVRLDRRPGRAGPGAAVPAVDRADARAGAGRGGDPRGVAHAVAGGVQALLRVAARSLRGRGRGHRGGRAGGVERLAGRDRDQPGPDLARLVGAAHERAGPAPRRARLPGPAARRRRGRAGRADPAARGAAVPTSSACWPRCAGASPTRRRAHSC